MRLQAKDPNSLVTASYSNYIQLTTCGSKETLYETGFVGGPLNLLLHNPNRDSDFLFVLQNSWPSNSTV